MGGVSGVGEGGDEIVGLTVVTENKGAMCLRGTEEVTLRDDGVRGDTEFGEGVRDGCYFTERRESFRMHQMAPNVR